MNTQSNAVPESPAESQAIAPAVVISPARRMYWSVRRELWENRWIYIAPLAVAPVVLAAFLIGVTVLPHHRMSAVLALDPAKQRTAIQLPYDVATGLIMAAAFFVGLFYCLDALQGERRDRSILFWKSLPVSDLTTVLAKASVPFLLLMLSFAITVVTQLLMMLLSAAVLLGSGLSVAQVWRQLPLSHMWLMLLYHLVTVHGLWYAPIYGWLLLISAWARRAPFLWAVLPLLAIGFGEKIAFNTSHFAAWLLYRISGPPAFNFTPSVRAPMDAMASLSLWEFLTTPGLWIGLLFAAAFLYAAAELRRYRGPV